jgi:hypothetical protein
MDTSPLVCSEGALRQDSELYIGQVAEELNACRCDGQTSYAFAHVLDLAQIILPCRLLSDLCEAQLRNPDQIKTRPPSLSGWWALAGAQKELAQPMPSSHLILLGGFTSTQ